MPLVLCRRWGTGKVTSTLFNLPVEELVEDMGGNVVEWHCRSALFGLPGPRLNSGKHSILSDQCRTAVGEVVTASPMSGILREVGYSMVGRRCLLG